MDVLKLENDCMEAALDSANGSLVRLGNKVTGWQLQARSELARSFYLVVPLPERLLNVIDGHTQSSPDVRQNNDDKTLIFTWHNLESVYAGKLDIEVVAAVSLTDNGLAFKMTIHNRSSYPVESVAYPYLADLPREGKLTRGHFAYCNMTLKSLYPEFENERGYWGVPHPIQLVPTPESPFVLVLNEQEGLYVGCHDISFKERVEFTFQVKPGYGKVGCLPVQDEIEGQPVSLEFMAMHHPFVQPGETYDLSPIVLKTYTGDWHNGTDMYKQWRKTWMQKPPAPDWLQPIHSWQQIQMSTWGDSLQIKYNDLIDYARQCQKHGVRAIQLTGWTLYGQDGRLPIHDIDPRLGTRKELKDAIRQIQEMGIKVVLYQKYTCVDIGTDWYKQELHQYTSKDIFGNTHGHEGWRYDMPSHLAGINTRPYAWMCMNSEKWQDIALNEIEKSLNLEPDGILLDESMWHGSNAFYCFDQTHGHRVPAYNFAGDELFEKKLLQLFESNKTQLVLAGEGPYDLQNRHYHLTYHRTHPWHIPAVRYIDPYLPMMNWAYGYDDRENINICLLYRYLISYEPRHFRGKLNEFPLTLEYGKKVDSLRRRYQDWLWDAEFRDTLGAKVQSDGGKIIYSVFYRKADNKIAVVVANHNDKNVCVNVTHHRDNAKFVMVSPEQPEPCAVEQAVEIDSRSMLVFMEC